MVELADVFSLTCKLVGIAELLTINKIGHCCISLIVQGSQVLIGRHGIAAGILQGERKRLVILLWQMGGAY